MRTRASALLIGALIAGCSGGSSSQARPTVLPTGGSAGQVGVKQFTFVDSTRSTAPRTGPAVHERVLRTFVYYPVGAGDQRPVGTSLPVVLFSHGLTGEPQASNRLIRQWVQAGFVVVAPLYPLTNHDAPSILARDIVNQPADATFVLDRLFARADRTGDPLHGRLDEKRVIVAGHSAGATTSIGLLKACCRDKRIVGAIVLAGSGLFFTREKWAGRPVPVLFVHGTNDQTVPLAAGQAVYESLPWPKAFISLRGADHTGPYGRMQGAAGAVVANTTTDFLRWIGQGDAAALRALRRDGNVRGVATETGDL